jgi:hypothetical protein
MVTAAVVNKDELWVGAGIDDDAISHEVTKGLKPTRAVVREGIPLEGSVERVGVVNKLLKILKSEFGSEG